jgi:hypothetical protein
MFFSQAFYYICSEDGEGFSQSASGGNTNITTDIKVFTDRNLLFTSFFLFYTSNNFILKRIKTKLMRTIKKFTFLLLLFISSFTYAQTGVLVTYYDGNSQGFNIESSGKLYFDSDNLNVKLNSTTTTPTTIPVTIIRKITFSTTLSTTLFAENKKNLILYPNPNSDIFRIKSDVTEKMKINIYSLQGQLVHQGNYESDEAINVSYLPSGLYLVQVNDLTIKFSKK